MSTVTTEDLEGYLKVMADNADKWDLLDYYIATDGIKGLLAYIKDKSEE